MTTPTAIRTQVPLPGDAPGLGYSSQTWLPQVAAYQKAGSGVALLQSASFTAGLQWFYPISTGSGNLTVTLPPANSQWQKAYVFKKTNNDANTVTIQPNGVLPDTIDGQLNLKFSTQYQTVYIVADGVSNWYVIENSTPGVTGGGAPSPTIYTSGSGTFTTTSTTTLIKVILQAAGGNGGNNTTGSGRAGGGGGGEYCEFIIPVSASTGYAYSVGAVGANTTFTVGSVVYTAAFGVSAPNANVASTAGGAGGGRLGPAGGTVANPGNPGASPVSESTAGECGSISGASGGAGPTATAENAGKGGGCGSFNGGTGGTGGFNNGGGGAASMFGPGGNGGQGTSAAAGANGGNAISTAYGAGGGGSAGGTGGAQTGGTGTGGCIIIIPLD